MCSLTTERSRNSTSKVKSGKEFGETATAANCTADLLAATEIGFVDHQDFHQPDAQLRMAALAATTGPGTATSRFRRASDHESFALLPAFGQAALLTAAEERACFLRMNFCKFQAEQGRRQLRPGRASRRLVQQIQSDLAEANRLRDRIIEANVRLIIAVARKLTHSLQDLADLTSEGLLPLMRAVELFDVDRGFRFSTYATWAIRNHLYRVLRRQQRQSEQLVYRDSSLWEIPVEPADNETAESGADDCRFDLDARLSRLTEREQRLIHARFGLNHQPQGQSLSMIAGQVGLSRERVRQIVSQALEKLRQPLTDDVPDPDDSPLMNS